MEAFEQKMEKMIEKALSKNLLLIITGIAVFTTVSQLIDKLL